ncbi:Ferritin heavy chain [Sciurus carolinensis]|uniref:Ferritin heavy chain n=1 Tax=Sciurus carolinensis TaxID=30640 RepID=A0AA41NFM7_SCICA|nr:Ferritin heavy chain [Sciurus carolinensis]
MTIASPWQVRQNYLQASEVVSHIYLSVSSYFDLDDAALKDFAKYFLHQSQEERKSAENR